MMNELTKAIHEITLAMNQAVTSGDEEEVEKLLNKRNVLMGKVDAIKAEEPDFQYSPEAKKNLENTLKLDQKIADTIKKNLAETQNQIHQIKFNKQMSQKYRPYYKQTNGAFIDSKK
ncbi:flagellar protein FliT [Neobacillus mesonae]|uniref:flagellar protein FliT n=1 Tax=Neobacillus mesonae TaxID=1193713 RepID=UPI00203B824E|nr:flagellar protein FliT [Neobacillus mesonae]MCM3569598.1 flagellar protein FliT [Neobacillus mesonae]